MFLFLCNYTTTPNLEKYPVESPFLGGTVKHKKKHFDESKKIKKSQTYGGGSNTWAYININGKSDFIYDIKLKNRRGKKGQKYKTWTFCQFTLSLCLSNLYGFCLFTLSLCFSNLYGCTSLLPLHVWYFLIKRKKILNICYWRVFAILSNMDSTEYLAHNIYL